MELCVLVMDIMFSENTMAARVTEILKSVRLCGQLVCETEPVYAAVMEDFVHK